MPLDPLPAFPDVAVWRLETAPRPRWAGGLLRHDPATRRWSWDGGASPEEAAADVPKALWTPTLLDAHTHLGDAFLRPERDRLPRDLAALVAPPHGLKHQRLANARPETVRDAMAARALAMRDAGTGRILDFREGGGPGVALLREATRACGLGVTAFGRPNAPVTDADAWRDEANELLAGPADGLGLSALADLPAELREAAADACRRVGKPLALHLSEASRDHVDTALALQPALAVHLVHATARDLAALVDARVLAVACPSSNRFFGARPPLELLFDAHREHGLATAFGTDNAMLGDGRLLDEALLAAELAPDAALGWLLASMVGAYGRAATWRPVATGPGLLWGVDRKVPSTPPDETPLRLARAAFARPPFAAPPVFVSP